MLLVGLTGGIGSGKSTAATLFQKLGVPVLDADHLAQALTRSPSQALEIIRTKFGEQALLPDGSLNREYMRKLVFNDQGARKSLEGILHPLILAEILRWRDGLGMSAAYAIVMVPLLFENPDFHRLADCSVLIDCDESTQVCRVMQRNGFTEEAVRAIINAQMSGAERRRRADYLLPNSAGMQELQVNVEKLHQILSNRAQNAE